MRIWVGEFDNQKHQYSSQLTGDRFRMVLQQDPKQIGRTDISDLDADPVVVWQHKHCKDMHWT